MRFVVSAAVAALAFSAVPAQAATYLVTGSGETTLSGLQCQATCADVVSFSQRVQVNVSFYVQDFEFAFPGSITANGVFYTQNVGIPLVNYQSYRASGTADAGQNLLLGGSGIGEASVFNQLRTRQESFSLRFAFTTQEVSSGSGFFYSTTAVPEPATWAMMIAGFGMAGAAMRRQGVAPRNSTRKRLIEA